MKEYTVIVYPTRTEWYLHGKLHREDGPAVEYIYGTKEWWVYDKRHREDGPAVEWSDGDKEWYVNGKRHRENGPACIWADGTKEWYLNGVKVTEEEVMGVKELTVAEIEKQLGYSIKIIK